MERMRGGTSCWTYRNVFRVHYCHILAAENKIVANQDQKIKLGLLMSQHSFSCVYVQTFKLLIFVSLMIEFQMNM